MGKENEQGRAKKEKPKAKKATEVKPQQVSRQYTGTFGKKKVAYTATAATQVFESNDEKVSFFHVSYTMDEAGPAERPILFCFNGGPGSSTVWLHLGLFGPRRMEFDPDGFKVGMQGQLVDNPHSILDMADVVCIDAMGTGLSRTAEKGEEKKFHHFKKDIEAFSEFIVHYLNRHGRWASPKFLAGESYGTLRGAGIAHELFTKHNVEFNGIVFISMILNYQTSAIDRDNMLVHAGNDLPFAVYLPTYAATAWYHERLPKKHQKMDLRKLLDEVEEFALGEYWSALAQGDRLDESRQKQVAEKLGEYTGLDAGFIDHYNLRIHIMRFCKELLRDRKRTVGRIDSRFTGIDRISAGDNIESDPSIDATGGVAASALNQYLREEIGFETDEIYEIMANDVWKNWDYEDFKGRYVDTSENLREVLSRSRGTKVLIANGYYDLATPHFATEYTMSHMGLDPEVRESIELTFYEAGHMMYIHQPSLKQLAADLRAFIKNAT